MSTKVITESWKEGHLWKKTKLSKNVLTSNKFIDVFATGKATSLTIYHHLWVNARMIQE